jgi:large conductance mechanosensitive channel protein
MFKELKEFALKGNIVDMATGIIIGAAFSTVVKSLVDDVIMPPIGLLMGGVDFSNLFFVIKEGVAAAPYATVEAANEAGAVIVKWGMFVNNVITFAIVALAVFMLIKGMNKMKKEQEEAEAEAAPEVDEQVELLSEIRDLLKK